MSKVVIHTDSVDGFFGHAKGAARRVDQAQAFDSKVTLSFEDTQRMFSVLSEKRRRLLREVMCEPQPIEWQPVRHHQGRRIVGEDGAYCFKSAAQSWARISEGCAFNCSQD